ncbi:MAG: SusC/RagA family TonB-linked outer membrane protein [Gemmatimonadales bacterium]|nr:SusC/RagA family TonB-linked outer membrane protein [Gemmatimonadales bacterium]
MTNQQGQYTIRGVNPGSYTLRIVMLGYGSQNKPVTVTAGQATTLDWSLSAVPYTLEEIVTTATGEQLKRELGNSVARVEAAQLVDAAPVTSLTEVLTGRVAGVVAIQNDGIAGSGSRIRIRGVSSASLATDPLIYVDGVRVSERGPVLSVGNGGNSPSFFNDLNPEEIESIEIVKGPSAATLYGTQAANGVIRVTTKRGKAGPAKWTVYAENGIVQDKSDYLPVYFQSAAGSTAGNTQQCLLFLSALGGCTAGPLYQRNIALDPETSPIQDAYRMQYGVQVNGGTDAVRYFLSTEFEDQGGTIKMPDSEIDFLKTLRGVSELPSNQLDPNHLRKINIRANVSASLSSKMDVTVNSGYVNTDNLIPQSGDNLQGVLVGAIFGSANPDAADNPWAFARPSYGLSNNTTRKSNHFINSANANFRPTSWLSTRATVGLDYIGFEDANLVRNGEACPFCGEDQGARTLNRFQSYKYSVDFGGTATLSLSNRIGSKTSVGVQYNKDANTVSFNYGKTLAPGAETFSGAAEKVSSEQTIKVVTLGSYVEQQFGLDDRLFITGALRVDQNSSFGKDSRTAYYPKVSGSWVAKEATDAGLLSSLRLRGAYGATGQQPGALAALTYYSGVTVALLGGNRPGVSLAGLGSPTLKPERSTEIEAGFDVGLFSNKVNVEFTAYQKKTNDALIARPLAGSLGAVATQFQNLGKVENKGIEVSVSARPIESKKLTWDLNLEMGLNQNKLIELADGVPDPQGFFFRHAVGLPLYALWGTAMQSYADANGDGIIVPSEVVVSDTALFLGNSIPNKNASLNSSIGLFGNKLRIGSQLEAKWGWKSLDINTGFQCLAVGNCAGLNDPNSSLFEQARAVSFTFGSYATDAKFLRLREMSLGWTLPKSVAQTVRASNATLTLTARNLAMWTPFTSWDPEVNTASGVAGDGPNYNFVQPGQPRTFLLRLNVQF